MSPTHNGNPATQRFKHSNAIKVCNRITFDFYTDICISSPNHMYSSSPLPSPPSHTHTLCTCILSPLSQVTVKGNSHGKIWRGNARSDCVHLRHQKLWVFCSHPVEWVLGMRLATLTVVLCYPHAHGPGTRLILLWCETSYSIILCFTGKSKEAERKRINKELANIRSKFKSEWSWSTVPYSRYFSRGKNFRGTTIYCIKENFLQVKFSWKQISKFIYWHSSSAKL